MNLPTFRLDPMQVDVPVEVEKFLYVVAVDAASPYQGREDLMAAMKAADTPIPGTAKKPGSAHDLQLEKLFDAAGAEWTYVHYDGSGGAMRDTLSGAVDVVLGPWGIWMPHVQEGNARLVFLIKVEKADSEGLADLPIPLEFAMVYEMIHQIQGVFTKAGTPKEINQKFARAFEAATPSNCYKEHVERNVHVVHSFSGDVGDNSEKFRTSRAAMKTTLTRAGLI
ncbi:MAG: tripartite tricarboxylate transporter substrate-binding protein [Pseudomonadota bacterium]